MTSYDYDLFVIGAGSGGVRAARLSAAHGVRVAIAEDLYVGGTCVNAGCIPKKILVFASDLHAAFQLAPAYGWSVSSPTFNWHTLIQNKNREIGRLNNIYREILNRSGCTLIEGRAKIFDPHTVQVADKNITAERILIATGSWPFVPEFPGREFVTTSNEVFHFSDIPKRVVIVGGGYIAVELAGIFSGLGAKTELVCRGDKLLRGFDEDIRVMAGAEIEKNEVAINYSSEILHVERSSLGELKVTLNNGKVVIADRVIYATGRKPKTEDLGLESTAVQQDSDGAIMVNENFQTAQPSIFALGDVINRMALTPVALAEASHLVQHLFGQKAQPMNYDLIPTAVFSRPNIGTVGLTESQARHIYGDISIFKSHFTPLRNALGGSNERIFMKTIVDRLSDRVLGVHMVGQEAGEIIQGIAIALKAGATKAIFDSTIGVHPTVAEEFVTMREESK